ncbi:unnamed protein product [Moneuplotes crassus]|uniref:EamA domain-containing protein n=1 Tax=Euplotes crassus TaxID=5936 RepID=A0AAD1UIF6_EUPCR|nr:unnamed protein product [Moneuplotes crassus]
MESFEVESEETTEKKEEDKNMAVGILVAIIALLCTSSVVPLVDRYEGVPSILRIIWRFELTVLYGFPLSVYYWHKNRKNLDHAKIWTLRTATELFVSSLCFVVADVFFIWSSDYTLVSHSYLLANLGGVFIVLMNLIRFLPVHYLEIFGTIIVVFAGVLCVNDNSSTKTNNQTNIFWGDMVAVACSPLYGLYVVYSDNLLTKLPAMVIIVASFSIQLMLVIPVYVCFSGYENTVSFDPHYGLLGWASEEYLIYSLTFVALLAGVPGIGGYVFPLSYFPPHIVASIFLLDPIVGEVIGVFLGQDNMPGILTYIGTLGVLVGLGLTMRGNLLIKKQQSQKKAQSLPVESLLEEFDTPSSKSPKLSRSMPESLRNI